MLNWLMSHPDDIASLFIMLLALLFLLHANTLPKGLGLTCSFLTLGAMLATVSTTDRIKGLEQSNVKLLNALTTKNVHVPRDSIILHETCADLEIFEAFKNGRLP